MTELMKFNQKTQTKCHTCHKLYKNCTCFFDLIENIPEFINERSNAIYKSRKNDIDEINKTIRLILFILLSIPMTYTPRCGYSIEEFPNAPHSGHDTSRVIGSLLINEINELVVNLSCGSNRSALRTSRSMFEWIIRIVAAISNRQIFSDLDSDKNVPVCYDGLTKTMNFNKNIRRSTKIDKSKKQTYKEIQKEIKKINESNPKEISWLAFRYNATIPNGLGKIPEKLNAQILSNIEIINITALKYIKGSEAIYEIYGLLSNYVHNDVEKIDEIPQDGATSFLNLGEFDDVYSILIPAIDIILYHYLILLDMDIYSEKLMKTKYRKKIKEVFLKLKFPKELFHNCFKLLESNMWDDPNKEFINH